MTVTVLLTLGPLDHDGGLEEAMEGRRGRENPLERKCGVVNNESTLLGSVHGRVGVLIVVMVAFVACAGRVRASGGERRTMTGGKARRRRGVEGPAGERAGGEGDAQHLAGRSGVKGPG